MIPQPRLLVALLVGAGLILLTLLSPLVWPVVIVYNLALAVVVAREVRNLPSPKGFTVLRDLPRPFSLGADQAVVIAIHHVGAAGLRAEIADHVPIDLNPRPRSVGGVFDAAGTLTLAYRAQPVHRGAYTFGRIDLRCWRPGGFTQRLYRIPAAQSAAVYPNILAVRQYDLTLRRGMRLQLGQRRARPPGATTAFAGLRDYLPGDDVRRISWKATARRDAPVTLEVEAERGQQAVIALDCGRLMTAPAGLLTKLDHAVNAALLLGFVAQRLGDRVGLLTFTDSVRRYLPPQRGPAQVHRLNQLLYDVRSEYAEPDFGEAFSHLARRLSRRSLIVVLTDVLDPQASRELVAHAVRLSARHLVLVVAMADPEVAAARQAPVDRISRAYEWAAAEELLAARRESFEALRQGGVLGLDVEAGQLSAALVERFLNLKERALL
jgi:uncharacterized protein (DUF58 family)